MNMTPELEAALHQGGWFPQRRVYDAQLDTWLRIGVHECGCHLFPAAIAALREYGDLVITNGVKTCHLSPEGCDWRGDKEEWLYWEWAVKEALFPLAYYTSGEAQTIAISYSGKIYCEGNGVQLLGNSVEEFLNNFIVPGGLYTYCQSHDVTPVHLNAATDREFERIFAAVYPEVGQWRAPALKPASREILPSDCFDG